MKYKLYTLDNQFIVESTYIPSNFTGIAEFLGESKRWFVEGNLHRLDGPACEYADGRKEWYVDDKLHRLDGPAYVGSDGLKQWFVDDKLHRIGGPALEYPDGSIVYCVGGKQTTEEQHALLVDIMKLKGLI